MLFIFCFYSSRYFRSKPLECFCRHRLKLISRVIVKFMEKTYIRETFVCLYDIIFCPVLPVGMVSKTNVCMPVAQAFVWLLYSNLSNKNSSTMSFTFKQEINKLLNRLSLSWYVQFVDFFGKFVEFDLEFIFGSIRNYK